MIGYVCLASVDGLLNTIARYDGAQRFSVASMDKHFSSLCLIASATIDVCSSRTCHAVLCCADRWRVHVVIQ